MKAGTLAGWFLAIAMVPIAAFAQADQPKPENQKPELSLTITPDHITVAPNDTRDFSANFANGLDQTLECGTFVNSLNMRFAFEVKTSAGISVPRSKNNTNISQFEPSPPPCRLRPGAKGSILLGCVMCAFDMRHPGVYTVQVSFPDPAHPGQMLGTSNKVTVTVKAPDTAVDTAKPAVQLILSPDRSTTTPDGNLELSLKWVNLSGEQQWCSPSSYTSGIDEEYIYDIRTSDGKPVQRALGIGSPNPWSAFCTVAPGASIGLSLSGLMHAFDMRHPGVYTVQVSLPDRAYPGQMLGTSNKITVTVKAP
jgi:hypothetical protein